MANVGLVRVSTTGQDVKRQHDAPDPICIRVFEERDSDTLKVEKRPELKRALKYLRPEEVLVAQEIDQLGMNFLEWWAILSDMSERGITVKVLKGIAAGEHTEQSFVLDVALALAGDSRRDIGRKTYDGLQVARKKGQAGSRPRVVDKDKLVAIWALRQKGKNEREITQAFGMSPTSVHNTLKRDENEQEQ